MDCHSESPLAISYPGLPLVAGNRVECSCVFEARNNDSGKAECLVSCMDQSIYYVAEDSVSEIALAVAVRSAFQLGTNPGPDRSLRSFPQQRSRGLLFGPGMAGRLRSTLRGACLV